MSSKHFSELGDSASRVLDAAEGLIQQQGYNGFSYDDVARLVGIKKPSIHHHFATKAELAAVVAQRYTHRFRSELLIIEGRHAKATDRLLAYAALFEQRYTQDRGLCVCGMLGAEAASLAEPVAAEVQLFFRSNLDWLAAVIKEGQQQGLLRSSVKPAALAEAWHSAMQGAMVLGRGLQSDRGPAQVAKSLLATLLA
ncbi:TetR/AcrR family transcriptional regulator [Paucibacter sp. APW11]|uniref:TetR/AcrR family transcriptional regulator n=1 Tax=Roseateles aquae TaxID=3077235 RepID=A0ABU3PFZ6_9BURK|nr:TetR/AcrR family transcriptional regulator [Paucibacter sp. APW11]MDT9001466.1 TetR/AcrR family transcriptional regulator [Paucibacter sp. APW11]